MSSTIQKLIKGLNAQTRDNRFKAYPAMFEITLGHPNQVGALLEAVMAEWPRGGTFADDAISYLPESKFPALVETALASIKAGGQTNAAESVIAHCSLQYPQALHPHLDEILRLRPNGDTYFCAWPWRESGAQHVPTLQEVLQRKDSPDNVRNLALEALFETREPAAMRLAIASRSGKGDAGLESRMELAKDPNMKALLSLLKEHQANFGPTPDGATDNDLLEIGYDCRSEKFHRLYSESAWHLIFNLNYLNADKQPLHLQKQHPTWHSADASAALLRFGGQGNHLCAVCGGQAHHLLTIDPVAVGLGIKNMKRLVLETCLSCLGWEEGALFYRHDADGLPTPTAYKGKQVKPRFPSTPFVETKVRLSPTPKRWFWQDWAVSNSRQNLHRVGGHPCWVQESDYLRCPDCGQLMQFLFQLDSNLPTSAGKEFLWGSGGLGYGFWCDSCHISGFQYQCT